jgi:hypothetical protein
MKQITTIVVVLLALAPILEPQPAAAAKSGKVLYYGPGKFESVLRVRARQGYKIRYDVAGYTSSVNCSDIGKVRRMSVNGGPYRLYQVMDCSDPTPKYRSYCKCKESDRTRHIRMGIAAEIDYKSALREKIVGRNGKVHIL